MALIFDHADAALRGSIGLATVQCKPLASESGIRSNGHVGGLQHGSILMKQEVKPDDAQNPQVYCSAAYRPKCGAV